MTMPNLRPSAPREHVDPSFDRRADLNFREGTLDARERALEAERRLLDQERARLDQRARVLEATRDLAGEQTNNVVRVDGRSPAQIDALAQRVIDAGKARRGELDADPPAPRTETEKLAQRLIDAGRRRRGEI